MALLETKVDLKGLAGLDANPPLRKIQGPSGKEYYGSVLCCLRISMQPRKLAIQTIEAKWFDPLILVTILTNCVTMAWQSPLDPCCTDKAALIEVMEWCYLYIFTFELVSKIFAYGFVMQEGTYLRDSWCQLDFVVVGLAWIPILFPSFGNYSVIRSVRALRPLRALKRVPGMPQMISAIMAAMPKLANVVALCAFIFLVFGIVGMELFKGALHYRCASAGFVETPGHPEEARRLEELVGAPAIASAGAVPDASASQHLDVLPLSLDAFVELKSIGEGSSSMMEALVAVLFQAAHQGGGPIVGGGDAAAGHQRRLRGGGSNDGGDGSAAGETGHLQSWYDSQQACNPTHNVEETRRRRLRDGGGESDGTSDAMSMCKAGSTCSYFDVNVNHGLMGFDDIGKAFLLILQVTTFDTWTDAMYALMDSFSPLVFIYFVLIALLSGIFVVQLFLAVIFEEFLKAQQLSAAKEEMQRQKRASREAAAAEAAAAEAVADGAAGGGVDVEKPQDEGEASAMLRAGSVKSDGVVVVVLEEAPEERSGCCNCAPPPGTWRHALGNIMTGSTVGNISTLLVLYNMGLMCAPFYGMSEEYAASLEEKATVVSWLFIIEMAGKLVGIGCANYWADGWNQLDGSIVTMSIVEMILTALFAGSGVKLSFLRMLRMLRVLRILRLMKSWKGLYKIIVTFGKAMPQMVNIFVLMFLALLIFSLLGMQLFAGIYKPETGYSPGPCPGDVCPDGLQSKPRYHWDYFVPAMLTCFIMMAGGWVDVVGPAYAVTGATAIVYCVSVVVIGCFLIMNLFIAVLLNAFGQDDDEEEPPTVNSDAEAYSTTEPTTALASDHCKSSLGDTGAPSSAPAPAYTAFEASWVEEGAVGGARMCVQLQQLQLETERLMHAATDDESLTAEKLAERARFHDQLSLLKQEAHQLMDEVGKETSPTALLEYAPALADVELAADRWPHDYSMLLFGPRNSFRLSCQTLVADPRFDQVIVIAIVISSICLALDVPRLDAKSTLHDVLHYLDYFWTLLFFCEMMSKVVSFGFACGEGTYVTNPWNLLDLVIVTVSFLVLLAEFFPSLESLKTLRILRVLRPLRLLARNPGMRLIIVSLFKSMPAVSNVFGVVIAFQLVFAILGMQLFMGSLGSCTDPTILTVEQCHPAISSLSSLVPPPPIPSPLSPLLVTDLSDAPVRRLSSLMATSAAWAGSLSTESITDSILGGPPQRRALSRLYPHASRSLSAHRRHLKGGGSEGSLNIIVQWANPPLGSFDSFGQAMMLLFVMSTGDGWDALMFGLMDATEPGHAPERNDFSAAYVFAVFWMFVGSFFAINLFVGVVVDNFNRINAEAAAEGGGSATMTAEQAQWIETMKMKNMAQPQKVQRPPDNCIRRLCFHVVTSSAFDTFIIGVIIANVGVMACDYWGIENDAENFERYNRAMLAFANIYYVEFCLKITGLGPYAYFGDNWCRFDCTLVCTSLLDQFAADLLEQILPIPPMVLRVLRVLRILRILRLLKGPGAKQVRDLIMTLVLSFPALINVGGVLALIVFMYAVLGVNLFTYVVAQENLTAERNFKTLGSSMLLLFQALTGDNWSGMMVDAAVSASTGKCSAAEGNCGSPGAIPFFMSFMLLASMVVLNLVVAVILENFSSLGNVRTDLVSKDDMDTFKEAWGIFDPDADLKIPSKDLPDLVLAVPPPMGLKGVAGLRPARQRAIRLVLSLEVRGPTGVTAKLRQDENGEVNFADVLDALVQRSYKNEEVEGVDGAEAPAQGAVPTTVPPGEPDDLEADEDSDRDVARMFAYGMIAPYVERWRMRFAARKAKEMSSSSSPPKRGLPPPPKPPKPATVPSSSPTQAGRPTTKANDLPAASVLPPPQEPIRPPLGRPPPHAHGRPTPHASSQAPGSAAAAARAEGSPEGGANAQTAAASSNRFPSPSSTPSPNNSRRPTYTAPYEQMPQQKVKAGMPDRAVTHAATAMGTAGACASPSRYHRHVSPPLPKSPVQVRRERHDEVDDSSTAAGAAAAGERVPWEPRPVPDRVPVKDPWSSPSRGVRIPKEANMYAHARSAKGVAALQASMSVAATSGPGAAPAPSSSSASQQQRREQTAYAKTASARPPSTPNSAAPSGHATAPTPGMTTASPTIAAALAARAKNTLRLDA